jgi:hypothetical protein
MHEDLETLDEAGCLPAIASYEGQFASSKCRVFLIPEQR